MISVEKREQIRRAYFVENKSRRTIAKELHCSRDTIKKAIASPEGEPTTLTKPRGMPVLGPCAYRIDELLAERKRMPRKQRYTGHKIYERPCAEGYTGSETGVRRYTGQRRRERRRPQVYLPLEFDPGIDEQVDWGEAVVVIAGERVRPGRRPLLPRLLGIVARPGQERLCCPGVSTGTDPADERALCFPLPVAPRAIAR